MLPPDPCPNQDGDILKRARYIFKRTITLSLGVLREPSVCVCVCVSVCSLCISVCMSVIVCGIACTRACLLVYS